MNELDVLLNSPLDVVHSLVLASWKPTRLAVRALSRADVRDFLAQPCGRVYAPAVNRFLSACTEAGWSATLTPVGAGVDNNGKAYPLYYVVSGWGKL